MGSCPLAPTPATWRLGFRRRRPWHVGVPDLRRLRKIQLGGIGSDHLFLDGSVDQPGQDRGGWRSDLVRLPGIAVGRRPGSRQPPLLLVTALELGRESLGSPPRGPLMGVREERSLELLIRSIGFLLRSFDPPRMKLVDPIRPVGSHLRGIGP